MTNAYSRDPNYYQTGEVFINSVKIFGKNTTGKWECMSAIEERRDICLGWASQRYDNNIARDVNFHRK